MVAPRERVPTLWSGDFASQIRATRRFASASDPSFNFARGIEP
jgi:hypothetical protein